MTHIKYAGLSAPNMVDIQAACSYPSHYGEGHIEAVENRAFNTEAMFSRLVELLVIKKILNKDDLTYLLRRDVEEIIGVDGPIA